MNTTKDQNKLRVAAIGDIHVKENGAGSYRDFFTSVSENADILCLCGDLTDHGLAVEAEVLASELQHLKVPALAVLGNHDFQHDQNDEIHKILMQAKVTMLDSQNYEMKGVGFAGVKGFCGGFGKYMLSAFGEKEIKDFVKVGVNESLHLENSLTNLQTDKKVVVLHYSPIRDTVADEPVEIHPYLGSSRLAEVIDREECTVVFHGHAHRGPHAGKTEKNIPVFNVSYVLMESLNKKKPYLIYEV